MVLSFLVFLAAFVFIGISSVRHSRGTKKDYYLASSSVAPSLVGLSAMATNNSGYMFIGVIGYTYATGLATIWMMIGWIGGDFLVASFVHRRLRLATERTDEVSFAGVLSRWNGGKDMLLQRTCAVISLSFLLVYASAQLVAGSKALHALFDWPLYAGSVTGAVLVVCYCLAGGIRASIWTDAAQSIVMIFAMSMLLFVGVQTAGGFGDAVARMGEIEGYLDWFPKDLALPGVAGGVLFAVAWAFAGFSVIGQPHVMVRFMTLSDSGKMRRARMWYYLWFTAFYLLATSVGMLARIYIDPGNFDKELALPIMAQKMLPPYAAGVVLAGIFAATMSTADSLILSCSSALTHDLLPGKIENTKLLKLGTFLITAVALGWALLNEQSVFNLVIMSWSGLASAFAPLLLYLCFGGRPSRVGTFIAIFVGLGTALLWRWFGWQDAVYEGMPGMLIGLLILIVDGYISSRSTQPEFLNSKTS